MDYLHAAEIAKTNVVTDGTPQYRDRAWKRWLTWLEEVGLEGYPYLAGFAPLQWVELVAGFAISICRGKHNCPGHKGVLVARTVDKTLSCLATSFLDDDQCDPWLSPDGKTDKYLKDILRHFRNSDPKEKPQHAITSEVLACLFSRPIDNIFAQHIADLCNGAYFFACRSCEYSQTSGTRKTKIITHCTVAFRQRNNKITDPKMFHTATTVSITFINQKNDNNYETVTQHTNGHAIQDPVAVWAHIVNRVLALPNVIPNTTINAFFNTLTKRVKYVTSNQILQILRLAVDELGTNHLGFISDDIGCHSIRLGVAMTMYLNVIKTYTIMLQGRWSSDAFLRYIWKNSAKDSHSKRRHV